MTVTIKLKELRAKTTLTQRNLGDLLGITETNYRKLENNKVKSVSIETVDKLCKIFKCRTGDILEFTNDDT
jgi:putative transcriptional regulator